MVPLGFGNGNYSVVAKVVPTFIRSSWSKRGSCHHSLEVQIRILCVSMLPLSAFYSFSEVLNGLWPGLGVRGRCVYQNLGADMLASEPVSGVVGSTQGQDTDRQGSGECVDSDDLNDQSDDGRLRTQTDLPRLPDVSETDPLVLGIA